MSKHSLFLALIGCAFASTAEALNINDAPIQQVTLYPTSAKIERSIPVRAGQQIVTLEGLTANFDMSSLQYQTQNIEVNAVSHVDNSMERPLSKASAELTATIKTIDNQIIILEATKDAAELQRSFLERLNKGSSNKVKKEAFDAYIEISKSETELAKLKEKKQNLTLELQVLRDSFFKNRNLTFHVNAAQSGQISISYLTDLARWQPVYKAELDTSNKHVKLTRMAMLAQRSGEDWNHVNLTISTITPVEHSHQLNPRNWRVDYYEPAPIIKPSPMSAQSYSKDSILLMDENYDPFPQFRREDLDFSQEFRSDIKASIPSSTQAMYLPLSTENHSAKLSIWVMPDQSLHAVINAEIPKLDSALPSGSLKLYRDNNYIGERKWDNNTDQTLQMNFGTDDQVIVKSKEFSKKNRLSTVQSETIQKKHYSIENLHQFPVELTVFQPLPQSSNSKLVVNSKFKPQPTAHGWQNQPNVQLWQLELAPKQKFELNVEHEFRYPNQGNTSGF